MPSVKRKFGDLGESEAENFLEQNGYKIFDKNFRVKNLGEIDLVGEKDSKLFFFEVKTRHAKYSIDFPIEFSINEKKRKNLKRICELYLIGKQVPFNKKWQVDAIFIKVDDGGRYKIEHMENILWESYY